MRRTLLAMAALAAACGSSPATTPDDGGGGGGDGPGGASSDLAGGGGGGGDLAMGPSVYPSGPYGNTVGAIFPPLVWIGYPDLAADAIANTKPYVAYTMDDARKSGHAYAMVHVSEFY
jgi:hypothetical protein